MASEYNNDTWDDLQKYIKRKGTNRTDEKIEKSRRYVKSFVSISYTIKNIFNLINIDFQLPDVTTEEHEDYNELSECDSLSDNELKKGMLTNILYIK